MPAHEGKSRGGRFSPPTRPARIPSTAGCPSPGGCPFSREVAPSLGEVAPSLGEVAPSLGEVAPSLGEVAPSLGEVAPTPGTRPYEVRKEDLPEWKSCHQVELSSMPWKRIPIDDRSRGRRRQGLGQRDRAHDLTEGIAQVGGPAESCYASANTTTRLA